MRWIMIKLRSQEGASFILALLFFLLCFMVGVSVLAAASSNAGKAKERKREQQEYFAASSALQLVCGRLVKVKYEAKASVTEIKEEVKPIITDPSTHYDYKKRTYEQKPGVVTFDADLGVDGKWKTILPQLQKELDYLFAKSFKKEECNGYHGNGKFQDDDTHTHSTLGGTDTSIPTERTLKIKVDDTGLPGDAPEELKKEVEVKISLGKPGAIGDEKYWLFLEARLPGGKGKFIVKAELKPAGSLPHINDSGTYNGPYPGLAEENRTALKWELVRIYKKIL